MFLDGEFPHKIEAVFLLGSMGVFMGLGYAGVTLV
jgi:hypothetical protein